MSVPTRVINIVGSRPNLSKITPLIREMQRHPEIEPLLIHTGQHYDENLSNLFFRQMGTPEPNINLGVGSGTHSQQTAEILKRVEPILLEQQPDLVLVVGDDFPWFSLAGRCHLPSVRKLRGPRSTAAIPCSSKHMKRLRCAM